VTANLPRLPLGGFELSVIPHLNSPGTCAPGTARQSRTKKVPAPSAEGSSRRPLTYTPPSLTLRPACPCTPWSRCSSISLGGTSSRWSPDSPFYSVPLRILYVDPR
jgi:hypothetical protein